MKNYKNKNPLYNAAVNVVEDAGVKYYADTKKCLYCYKPMQQTEEENQEQADTGQLGGT